MKTLNIRNPLLLFSVIALVCVGLWLLTPPMIRWSLPANKSGLEFQSQFGDQFTAIEALFSALAFAGVVTALLLQIGQQREQEAQFRQQLDADRRLLLDELQHERNLAIERDARKAAVDLFSEWHSPLSYQHRNKVGAALWNRNGAAFFNYSTIQNDRDLYDSIGYLANFFFKCALLADGAPSRPGLADPVLVKCLLAAPAREWHKHVFANIAEATTKGAHEAFDNALQGICAWLNIPVPKRP